MYSSSASTTVLPNSNLPSMLPGQHFTSYEEMRLLVCGINCDKTLNQSFNLMQAPPDAAESRHSLRGAWLRSVDYSHFAAASSLNTQPVTSYFGAPRGFTRLAVRGSCLFSRSFTAFTASRKILLLESLVQIAIISKHKSFKIEKGGGLRAGACAPDAWLSHVRSARTRGKR